MEITDVALVVLELPNTKTVGHSLVPVAGIPRVQYTHRGRSLHRAQTQAFLEVRTASGLMARCDCSLSRDQVEILRHHVLGANALHREHLFQMFHKGTRWVYQPPGWFGAFDNCLWDLAGQVSGLPVHALIGRVRAQLPVYLTGGDGTVQEYLAAIEQGQTMHIQAYKFHTYKGGDADIPIFREVRRAVGDAYTLINDPVCSYTLREALAVGRVMEELGFLWLEEPMHEQKMNLYQELCRCLEIPVMATETLMHDMDLTAQWLLQGATDFLRARATYGTTQVLKLAHFAELQGARVELNGPGGLSGLVHAHVGCCLENTSYYEFFGASADALRQEGACWGLVNAPLIRDGCIAPPEGPGWGAEWDEELFQRLTVARY